MAAALERLSAFEDMACGVEREREEISARLEELRNRGREKTVQFRELLAQKLVNNNMKSDTPVSYTHLMTGSRSLPR